MAKIVGFTKAAKIVFLLMMVSFALSGCVSTDVADARFRPSRYRSGSAQAANPVANAAPENLQSGSGSKGAINNYLALIANKKAVNGFGVIPGPWVLYAPMRTQVQVGLFNPKRMEESIGAQGCIETDDKDSSLPNLRFDVICMQFVTGGAVIRAWDHNTSFFSPIARVDIPNILNAYLAIDHNDMLQTTFLYSASDPLVHGRTIGVGGSLLPSKAEVGFDNFAVPWTGPVYMPTDSKLAREYTYKAMLSANDAYNLIDGGKLDYASAKMKIDQGLMNSQLAKMKLDAYTTGSKAIMKLIGKASKSLVKGDKALNKAREKVDAEKVKPASKSLIKALKAYDKSIKFAADIDF